MKAKPFYSWTMLSGRRIWLLPVYIAFQLFAPVSRADLAPMSEGDLRGVQGQEGAALEFDFRLNETMPPDGGAGPSSISGCAPPSSSATDSCRISIEFENRDGGSTPANAQWLVFKDVYGRLFIPNMYIDATTTPTTPAHVSSFDTPFSTVLGTTGTPAKATTFANLSAFKDISGNCLLNCQGTNTPNPYGIPALQISMKNANGAFNNENVAVFNNTVVLSLNIGGTAVEYGSTGYTANQNGSFAGLRIGDINPSFSGAPYFGAARIDYSGRVLVYGF